MSDCPCCPVEKDCDYEYKPCDCFNQRKFKPKKAETPEELTMSEIIGRVAKALCGNCGEWSSETKKCGTTDGTLIVQCWANRLEMAQKALQALHDAGPSARMVEVGVNARNMETYGDTAEMVVKIFKAMIAAAESEGG
jgi:hypothetical protein